MKKPISLVFAALMALSLPGYAAHDGTSSQYCQRHGQAVSGMPADVDQDGSVTWEEAHNTFVKNFDSMDVNQDGVLSVDEFKGCSMGRHVACRDKKSCKRGAHGKRPQNK